MKTIEVTIVRIYLTESSHLIEEIINYLKNEVHIREISIFRAIRGFGETGEHSSSIVDLSLDLPLAIEFFNDDKSKVEKAIDHINKVLKPKHIVAWQAKTYL